MAVTVPPCSITNNRSSSGRTATSTGRANVPTGSSPTAGSTSGAAAAVVVDGAAPVVGVVAVGVAVSGCVVGRLRVGGDGRGIRRIGRRRLARRDGLERLGGSDVVAPAARTADGGQRERARRSTRPRLTRGASWLTHPCQTLLDDAHGQSPVRRVDRPAGQVRGTTRSRTPAGRRGASRRPGTAGGTTSRDRDSPSASPGFPTRARTEARSCRATSDRWRR